MPLTRVRRALGKWPLQWAHKTARANYWRVCGVCGYYDLIQDAHLVFARIVQRYPDVNEPKHVFRLFQRAYVNHIHDLARKHSRLPKNPLHIDNDLVVCGNFHMRYQPRDPFADMLHLIAEAPADVRIVLKALISTDAIQRPFRVRSDSTRETWNERFCRLANVDPRQRNLYDEVKRYLQTANV